MRRNLLKAAYIEMLRNCSKVVNHLAEDVIKAGGIPPVGGREFGGDSPW